MHWNLHLVLSFYCLGDTVEPALSGYSKRRHKLGFQDGLALNAGQRYSRMLQESILQYFRPPLSYHLSLKIFVLPIFEWPLKTGFTLTKILLKTIFQLFQGWHRLEKYLNVQDCLEKSLKIQFALKSTGKTLQGLEKSLSYTIYWRIQHCL